MMTSREIQRMHHIHYDELGTSPLCISRQERHQMQLDLDGRLKKKVPDGLYKFCEVPFFSVKKKRKEEHLERTRFV